MADAKISALTNLTAADPTNDMIPIVDVSDTPPASGNTKRISINNLLACSPSATLASATITGDLTVDTSTLKVDSTLNRVGILTASPSNTFQVGDGSADSRAFFFSNNDFSLAVGRSNAAIGGYIGSPAANVMVFSSGAGVEQYRITAPGIFSWSDGAGGTRMTLNATGLGVGTSPVTALSFPIGTTKVVGQSAVTGHLAGNVGTLKFGISDAGGDYSGIQVFNTHNGTYSSQDIRFFTAEGGVSVCTERMRITPSGNVGIGVTPSGTIYSSSETRLVVKGTSGNFAGTLAVQSKGTTNAVTGFLTAGDGTNEVAVGSTTNSPLNFYTNNALKATIDASGNLILQSSATPATLATNGMLTVNATSNTNLRFSYRGSDGTTRVANITLA